MFHTKMLHRPNLGILLLRLAVGIIFVYAGYMKITNMEQTITFFGMIGFGPFWAWVAALVELIGGSLMIVGYLTQISGILLMITMIVALEKTFPQAGFTGSLGVIMLGISSLSIAISGCGSYSACGMFHGKQCKDCKDNGKCACQHK
jgi:putative oxidoreductase